MTREIVPKVKLGEISDLLDYGVTSSAIWEPEGPKFLRITDIRSGRVDWNQVPWCKCDAGAASRSQLRPGDIVFARTGSTGSSFLISECPHNSVFASYLIRLRLADTADPPYVAHFFRTPNYWAQITKSSRGAIQSGINATTLRELQVPLPSMAEQRRIAEVLDQAEVLRGKRREALARLDELTQSIFVDMFGDLVSNPKFLPVVPLKSLTRIGTGSTPSRKYSANFGGTTPWVKTTEVCGNTITATEEQITSSGLAAARCKIYPKGSIVIALYGQGKTRGRCGLLGVEAATNQACAVLPPDPNYETYFLFKQLEMAYERLRGLSRGGNQANLNLGLVSDFEVLLPSLDGQREFARRVEAVERLKASHRAHLAELDELFGSLQQRAFRGEL